ncbi:MAG: GNAT family N-acetyltransferase [Bacteroidota bacterium]|nr:GNAT family N-acetyltransferase [Bacteroidota bacterium]
MNTLSIQSANKSDSEVLSRICVESKMYWKYPIEWLKLWLKELSITQEYIENYFVFTLNLNGEIIGFISIEEDNEMYKIGHLWVKPKFIGMGYGKRLLNEVIAMVVKQGAEIIVESDPHAEQFYISQGFRTFDKKEGIPKGRYLPLMRKKNIAHALPDGLSS